MKKLILFLLMILFTDKTLISAKNVTMSIYTDNTCGTSISTSSPFGNTSSSGFYTSVNSLLNLAFDHTTMCSGKELNLYYNFSESLGELYAVDSVLTEVLKDTSCQSLENFLTYDILTPAFKNPS